MVVYDDNSRSQDCVHKCVHASIRVYMRPSVYTCVHKTACTRLYRQDYIYRAPEQHGRLLHVPSCTEGAMIPFPRSYCIVAYCAVFYCVRAPSCTEARAGQGPARAGA